MRNTHWENHDAVAHAGSFLVGADGCVYVVLEGEKVQRLAVLDPGIEVRPDGLASGGIFQRWGEPSTFERVNVRSISALKVPCDTANPDGVNF